MANDNRRSNKAKDEENVKSKKTVTPDASPASSTRRSSRETSSIYKVKEDENVKSKKKALTPDASPASSSRRSSRETSSGIQEKESPVKENPISTRKSARLEKRNGSGTTPVKGKAEKTHEETVTPTKQNGKRKNSDASLQSRSPVSPASSNMKSKKGQVVSGGRKRKSIRACINKDLSNPPRVRTEEGDDKDKESDKKSSESNSSSSSCREVEKPNSLKSVEVIDGSDDDCSNSNGEESTVKASKRQRMTSDQEESLNDGSIVPEQDRTPCEAAAVAEIAEKNNVVSRIEKTHLKHQRERERETYNNQSINSMASSKLVKAILDPKKNPIAALHKKTIETRLRKYGLRYDDLYDPMESLDIKEALDRLPREVVDARNQRLLRAMDLSMKHEYLSQDLQAQQTPFRSYLSDMLALVEREKAEREALGALPLQQRTLP